MSRSLFVNIVVNDLPRSKAFFTGLGFRFNPQFTNDEAACMVLNEGAYFMLHTPPSMQRFNQKPPCDLRTHLAALYAFSVDSKEEVDALTAKALASGGGEAGPRADYGFMVQHSFLDPDGHYWEVLWMDPSHVQPQEATA